MPSFHLSLLGRFELIGPDGVVDLPSKKLAGLLAYLACTAPQPQLRERLSALLWGSHFDTQAKQNLRQVLFRLRKVLGRDALESDGEVISLNATAVLCDVSRFEALVREGGRDALREAADLYRGRLIDDVAVSEEGWSEWLTGERERLQELALGALVRLGEQDLAAGNAEHALQAGQRAVALNNMREDAHRLIVQALAATGRKAEALKHYQHLVALLKRELDAEPDEAITLLVAELRSSQPPSRSPTVEEIAEPVPLQPDLPSNAAFAFANARGQPEHAVHAETLAMRGDEAASAAAVRSGSERRQLTIMVCKMARSAALAARLDPEDMRDLVVAFHKAVADAVGRFGGYVAQHLSDGALVYFGYPVADEHDAERAVCAGLAILEAVGTLEAFPDEPMQARAGIATGLVVVGEQGNGDTQQRVAIGETPELAAQLQAAASPGEVLIAAGTRRLVGRLFDCRALDPDEAKGLAQTVEAWRVHGETAGVSRFEARRSGAPTPLVGRQEEIDLLLRRWDQAKLGEGRVVLLSGEPGIGKSSIAESLLAGIGGEPHVSLRYFCSPHHTHSALHPFIVQLEQAASFEPGSGAGANLDRLEALLKPAATNVPRDVGLIAELLGVPADERYPAPAVSPQQKREMTLTALLNQLEGTAAQNPVLIVFEDAHWIDPTSLDLLDRAVARVTDLPVLLVITFRAEFQPTWVGQPHVTMLPLSRLGRRDSAGMIGGVTDDKELPSSVVEQILARADGVPLFIEELTSTLLESGLLREMPDRYVLEGPLPPRAIPTTLQALLVARLDRLALPKDVAQIGAAIGRQFSHELIAALSALAPMDLDVALERLTASGLISRRGTPPEATYTFKHALVQDAAYVTMLKSRRRQLHASIAKVLVERFPKEAESLPEVVAQHFTEAGLASEAIDHWVKAGRLAQARWANREAVEFFEQALHLLAKLPESRETLERAIDLRFDLRASLAPLGEFERIFACLREAEGLARTLGDQRRLGQMFAYMCHNVYQAGHPREALGFGRDAVALAEKLQDIPLQVTANLYFGAACIVTGDYRQANDLLRQVLRLLESDPQSEPGLARFGLEFPAVLARGYLTWGLADQGAFEEGIIYGQEAIRLAQTFEHPYSLVGSSWSFAYLQIRRGQIRDSIDLLERGLALARESNLIFFSTASTGTLGYAYALSGRLAEGISLLEHALNASETMGYGTHQARFLVDLGEAYVLAERLDDAHEVAARALVLARERGRRSDEARALRLLAKVSVRRDPPEVARGHLRDALALAEELGMRPLVADCHHGLGKLCRRMGTPEQASEHIATATTMYREMDMRSWLERAQADMVQLQ